MHWYGVMMALGFLAGLLNWRYLGRREGWDFGFCSDLLLWVMVAGILGARLAHVLSQWRSYLAEPMSVFWLHEGGLIYYGGFLGAGVALAIFARVRRLRLTALMDFVITSVPLGHALGRLGCFLNGCCHGVLYDGPLAVQFPYKSPIWWRQVDLQQITRFTPEALPVHPTQLYEALFNLVLYGLLLRHYLHRRRDGEVLALYLLVYPVGRFLIEWLRGDPRAHWAGLSVAQWLCIGLFAVGCGLTVFVKRRGRPAERRDRGAAPPVQAQ